MAKKKKKGKGKPVKPQEEKPKIKIISLEEHFKRQHRHDFRIEVIRENDEGFRDVKETYDDIIKLEKEKLKWEKYVNCDKIPDLQSPPAIRTYLYKWLFDEWKLIKSVFNWVLDIDERSILTQEMTVPDVTRVKLRSKVPLRGQFSAYHVENAIKMVDGIEELLDTGGINQLKAHEELVKVKNEVCNRIRSSIDNLSYFILFNTNGNMQMIDAISEKYIVQTNPFDVSFWGIRSVPCDFTKIESPEVVINLEAIDAVVTLPIPLTFENMLIRGLHLKFDHRSSFATSIDLQESLPDVRDFKMALVKEWTIRKQIEAEKLQQMREHRQHYEEELRIQEEEAKKEEANKNKKGAKDAKPKKKPKKAKKAKVLVEPPIVAADTFLDVEDEFVERDDIEHQKNMELLQPELLNLEPGEINLREYVILGGVYEINFLRKPGQLLLGSCYLNEKEMPEKLRYRDFECTVEYADARRSTEFASRESQLLGPPNATKRKSDESFTGTLIDTRGEVVLKSLVQVKVRLPSNLCRWDTPKTCRWSTKLEELMDSIEEDKIETMSTTEDGAHFMPIVTKDMYLGTMETRKRLHYVIKSQILPRMDSMHNFPDEVATEMERLATMAAERDRLRKEAEMDVEVEDDGHSMGASRASAYKEKVIAEYTPPASLFPRPMKVAGLKISSNEFLGDESSEEIKNLSDADRKLLSEYLAELDKLAEERKPVLISWWDIVKQMNKSKTLTERKSLDTEERVGSGFRRKMSSEKHSKKFQRKLKGRGTNSRTSTSRSTSKISGVSIASLTQEPTNLSTAMMQGPKPLTEEEEVYSTKKGAWSTDCIFKEDFTANISEMKFWANRLGIFGFAFKRYLHFPFKNWAVYPDSKKAGAAILEIVSPFASFFVTIEDAGYTASVMTGMYAHAKLIEPTDDLRKFRQEMEALGLNIFTKQDTSVYVKGISAKHLPLEYHVYQTISQFCLTYKFCRSKWNWLAHRRVLVMKFGTIFQQTYEMDTIRITPEESQFCTVIETCTPLDKVVLDYIPTAKTVKFEPDMLSLLLSQVPAQRARNAKVEYLAYKLLKAVQPLTYCK